MRSSDGWDYHQRPAWYFHEVQQHPTHLEQLFELRIARDELVSTFEQLAQGGIHPIKVLVSYNTMQGIFDTHAALSDE